MKIHNMKRFLLSGGILWLSASTPAFATLQEALDAISDRDYIFAVEELNRLADKEGNAEARYHLGRLYEQGTGVAKDEVLAVKIYKQAAGEGSSKAALKVGNAYYTGTGMDKNYEESFKWYQQAAEGKSFAAQYNIGLMYEEGLGVKKDSVKAFEAYKASAEQGYGPAQFSLGRMYLKGIGTPQDFSQAIFWHKLAADQGDVKAQMDLANLLANTTVRGLPFSMVGAHVYFNLIAAYGGSPLKEEAIQKRDELTQKMSSEDVLAAQTRAQKWKKKTREESLPALIREATLLEEQENANAGDTETDQKKKEELQEIKVTVKTDVQELVVAAGVSRRDLNKSVRENNFLPIVDMLKEKANGGDQTAQLALADLYLLGQGMEEKPLEAFKLYSDMTAKNNAIAFFKLAPMYCEGNVVEPDLAECYKYMLLAKKYADEESLPAVQEALQMLDENLEKDIRDVGQKLADEWGKQKEKEVEKPAKKKGMFSGVFGGGSSSDNADSDAMKKPEEKKPEKKEKAKDDTDELFPDL